MARLGTVAAAVGLAGLVVSGAARAQDPSPREKLRARIVSLRAEVDVLSLERAADREDLLESLRSLHRLRRDGLDKERLEAIEQTTDQFARIKAMADGAPSPFTFALPGRPDPPAEKVDPKELYAQLAKDPEFDRALKAKGLKPEDLNPTRFGQILVEEETKARDRRLSELVDQKRARFAAAARQFHEKRLDLEDAERRYRETR